MTSVHPTDPTDPTGPPRPTSRRLNICLACSHGGHLTEMLQLQQAFEGHDTFYFCYDAETTRVLSRAYLVPNMARNPIQFLKNLFRLMRIFWNEHPDLIVSTGAEIAIPAVERRRWCANLWLWWILTMVCITAIYAYFW